MNPWFRIGGCALAAWLFGLAATACDHFGAGWLVGPLAVPTIVLALVALFLFIDEVT